MYITRITMGSLKKNKKNIWIDLVHNGGGLGLSPLFMCFFNF